MSRTLRIILAIVGALVVLLAITPFLVPANQFRPAIESQASTALGRKVDLGSLSLSPFSRSLTAETLAIADDPAFSKVPFLSAKSVTVGVELLPLIFSRSLRVTGIAIESPQVTLLRSPGGRWNYSSLSPSSSVLSDLSFKKFRSKNGRIIVGSTNSQKRSTYDHVDVIADASVTSRRPIIATADLPGDGHLKLVGSIGPINQADASLTPLDARINIGGFNLASTGFLDQAYGLGGLLDLDATISSKNDEAEVKGAAKLSRALLVAGGSPASQPVTVHFTTKYNLHRQSGVLNPSTLNIRTAAARLNGTYDASGEYTLVNIQVVGEHMPVMDVESFLPAIGIHLPQGANLTTGTVSAHMKVVGPTNNLVANGNVGLYGAKMAGFDLGAHMGTISAFTGLQTGKEVNIEQLTTNLRVAPNGLRFDNFNAIVPSVGHVIGSGTIDAGNNLDFKMVATVTSPLRGGLAVAVGTAGALNQVLGGLMGGGTRSESKGQRVPFLVKGTTSNPQFIPDMSGIVVQTLKDQLSNLSDLTGPGTTQKQQGQRNPFEALGGLFRGKRP
jgi:AsmA protein